RDRRRNEHAPVEERGGVERSPRGRLPAVLREPVLRVLRLAPRDRRARSGIGEPIVLWRLVHRCDGIVLAHAPPNAPALAAARRHDPQEPTTLLTPPPEVERGRSRDLG